MILFKVDQGRVGVSINSTNNKVLLQVEDTDGEQARVVLTPEEAIAIADDLYEIAERIQPTDESQ
jgi:hypothetical protein